MLHFLQILKYGFFFRSTFMAQALVESLGEKVKCTKINVPKTKIFQFYPEVLFIGYNQIAYSSQLI